MDWDLNKGEILKTYKMILTGSKRFFSWKKAYAIIFAKFSSDLKPFWQVTIFHTDFPTNQIMDWDLNNGEILKTYKNEFDWLKNEFFHEKRHTRAFLQSFKWFKAILTSYHISHQTPPQTKSWIGT